MSEPRWYACASPALTATTSWIPPRWRASKRRSPKATAARCASRTSPEDAIAYSRLGQRVADALERWPGVTVARLSGYALGTGLELALACDVLIGSSDVRLGLPGLAWALVPCLGGLRRLSCRLPAEMCSDLFLGGEVLEAQRALELGLLDRLSDGPIDRFVAGLSEFTPAAVDAIRGIRLDRQGEIDRDSEAELFAQPFASGECQKRLRKLLAG
jgi:enoyl-CoA hydratase/carnithine racemase